MINYRVGGGRVTTAKEKEDGEEKGETFFHGRHVVIVKSNAKGYTVPYAQENFCSRRQPLKTLF